jgi:hypothetical protein
MNIFKIEIILGNIIKNHLKFFRCNDLRCLIINYLNNNNVYPNNKAKFAMWSILTNMYYDDRTETLNNELKRMNITKRETEIKNEIMKTLLLVINDYFYNSELLTDKQKDYMNYIIFRNLQTF